MEENFTQIKFTGIMAVPDDYNRIRLLLIKRPPDVLLDMRKKYDIDLPFKLYKADSEDVCGIVTVNLPKHFKNHWIDYAEKNRGRVTEIEVMPRKYLMRNQKINRAGISFDLKNMCSPSLSSTVEFM